MPSNEVTQTINSLAQIQDTLNFKMKIKGQDKYLIKTCNAIDLAIKNLNEYKQNRFIFQRIFSITAKYLPLFNIISILINIGKKLL